MNHPRLIIVLFLTLAVICGACKPLVDVNYDMTDYLPEDSPSTVAMDVMENEFDDGIPGARVMVRDVSLAEALQYKAQLEAIDGVTNVAWLDDAVSIDIPLEYMDQSEVKTYYKDGNALFSVTIDERKNIDTVASSDNEDIGLVQFAMKTQTISVEDEETAEEEDTTEKTFFQKLRDLF